MKQEFKTILILVLLVFSANQNTNGQVSGSQAKLEAEIGKVIRDYYDAFSRRDAVRTSAIWADDGFSYSPEAGYQTNGQVKEFIGAYLGTPMAAAIKESYEVEDLKVFAVTADTATANYTVISKTEQSGVTDIRRDRTTNVLARRNGNWQIVADHTSLIPKPTGTSVSGLPVGWKRNSSDGYLMTVDTNVKHGGKASATIKFTCGEESLFGSLSQMIAADEYRGKRVRLSGWMKSENAKLAGFWMRLDGDRRTLGFDNMMDRAVTGSIDWKRYEVILDVPVAAITINFGTILDGKGQVWVDDLKLEAVGSDVPTTNQLSVELMQRDNPNRTPTKLDIKQGVNLDFEKGANP